MNASFVLVLTTLPVDGDAEAFARTLIDERLAACVNILPPMQSIYRWEGTIEQAEERQLLMKTAADRVEELKKRFVDPAPVRGPRASRDPRGRWRRGLPRVDQALDAALGGAEAPPYTSA